MQELRQHLSPDVAELNAEQLSVAVSGGQTAAVLVSADTVPSEHEEQLAFVQWCWMQANDPDTSALELMYANVNGQYRQGQRPEPGLRAGVPDLFLPAPSYLIDEADTAHGLYIEMKKQGRQNERNGGLSDQQVWWVEHLRQQGYYVAICYGCEEAKDVTLRYLRGEL